MSGGPAGALGGLAPAARAALADTAARCPFPPGPLRLGVSGGPDSSALLVLARVAGHDVTAVHVDHGLRAGGEGEAAAVAALAERWGAAFESHAVAVAPGPNLEERARQARWEVLGPDALTGHTADDQAETILLALMRGAGLDGLAGMPAERHPLLGLRRADTERICLLAGHEPVRDPTNDDRARRRNRVRHELLPLVADIAGRDPVPILCRQAAILRDDAAVLDGLAAAVDPTSAAAVAAAHPVVAARALRAWLRDEDGHPPDAAAVARVRAVAAGDVAATHIAGGREVRRRRGRLEVAPAAPPRA